MFKQSMMRIMYDLNVARPCGMTSGRGRNEIAHKVCTVPPMQSMVGSHTMAATIARTQLCGQWGWDMRDRYVAMVLKFGR